MLSTTYIILKPKRIHRELTCTTALQNSNEFMNTDSSGISLTSSGVNLCHSADSMSKDVGKSEYKPLKP